MRISPKLVARYPIYTISQIKKIFFKNFDSEKSYDIFNFGKYFFYKKNHFCKKNRNFSKSFWISRHKYKGNFF